MGYGRESMLERPGMVMGCFGVLSAISATDPFEILDLCLVKREEWGRSKARSKSASSDKSA